MKSSCTRLLSINSLKKITAVVILFCFMVSKAQAQYCTVAPSDCENGDLIANVTFETLNNSSDCATSGYTDYSLDATVNVPDIARGYTIPISFNVYDFVKVGVWIDYDHNNTFDASEFTLVSGPPTTSIFVTGNIDVPASATLGLTKMRVRCVHLSPISGTDACTNFLYSETEDYNVNIINCAAPVITSLPANVITTCGHDTSIQVVASGSLLTYQWQYKVDANNPWTDVPDDNWFGGKNALLRLSITWGMTGYQYRVIINSACGSITSNPVTLTVNQIVVDVSPPSVDLCGSVSGLIPLSITTDNPYAAGSGVSIISTYPSNTLNTTIPDLGDNTGITSTITVPAYPPGEIVFGVYAGLNIQHSRMGDIIAAIKAPNNNVLNLDYGIHSTFPTTATTGFQNTWIGGPNPNYTLDQWTDPWNQFFHPDAVTTTNSGFPPSAPTSLVAGGANATGVSDLFSMPSGNWTLGINDFRTPNEGTLNNWNLYITHGHLWTNKYEGIWSPATGLFFDAAGTMPYVEGWPVTTVYLNPTSNIVYTVTPYTMQCLGVPVSVPVTVSSIIGPITSQPANRSICDHTNTSFSVSSPGSININYQWKVSTDNGVTYTDVSNAGVYSGANTAILTLTDVPLAFSGYKYKVALSSVCSPTVTSAEATLTVNSGGASITTQPETATVCEGSDHTFTIAVTGGPVTYQWQESTGYCSGNFTDIPGAVAANYTITNISYAQTYHAYRCVVTSGCGTEISNCVLLYLALPAYIYTQPADVTGCEGSDAVFSVQIFNGWGIFQWQVSTDNGITYTDITGATNYSLIVPGITAAMSGNKYRVLTSTIYCPSIITSSAATLSVVTSPVITQQPVSVSVCSPGYAHFFVESNTAGLTYQWQVSTGGGPFTDIPGAHGDSLYVYAANTSFDGNQYQVVITGSGCSATTTSVPVTLHVGTAITITTDPQGTAACEGNVVTFNSVATGSSLSYQWQVSTGSGPYTDIPGATSSIYVTDPVTLAMNNYHYHVIVSNSCATDTSAYAVLTVGNTSNPVITTQPQSATICSGTSQVLTIAATGPIIFYHWEVSTTGCTGPFASVAGATSATLTTGAVTVTSYFRCRIWNPCGTGFIYSDCATLTVNGAIDITTQPADQNVCAGANANFNVVVGSAGATYQWQVSAAGNPFTDIAGETNSTLSIPVVTATLSGNQYQVLVIAPGCATTAVSATATLTVDSIPVITSWAHTYPACPGSNVSFAVTATGSGLTYQWNLSTDHGVTYTPIAGATNSTYTSGPIDASMHFYLYQATVSNSCGTAAAFSPDTLYVLTPATITSQPHDASTCAGTSVSFTVAFSLNPGALQWQVSTTGCPGTFVDIPFANGYNLYLTNVTAAQDGYAYRCIVANPTCTAGPIISDCATLTVTGSIDITSQPVPQTVCVGTDVVYSVTVSGSGLTYQWQEGTGSSTFVDIPGATGSSLTIPNVTTTLSGHTYHVIISGGTCAIPVTSANAYLVVNGPPVVPTTTPQLYICEGSGGWFDTYAGGTNLTQQWQVSTDGGLTYTDIPGATTAHLYVGPVTPSMNGYLYRNSVMGNCTSTPVTSIPDTLYVIPGATITTQPADVSVCPGNDAIFTAAASGTINTIYWQVSTTGCSGNYVSIPGAVNTTLSLSAVTAAQDGYAYRCVLISSCGNTLISYCAVLHVGNTIITSQPSNTTVCSGTSATFTVAASGSGNTYQWQVSLDVGSSYQDIPGATNATLTVPFVNGSSNDLMYQVIISNPSCPAVISNAATLSIAGSTGITVQPEPAAGCEGSTAAFTFMADNMSWGSSGLSYQWQVSTDNGVTFTAIPGAEDINYIISSIDATINGNLYRCIITSASPCPGTFTSDSAPLTVYSNPVISATPSSPDVCWPDLVQLTATGAGTGGAYYWPTLGINGPSATAMPFADLNIPNSHINNVYEVTAQDANGCTGSTTVTVIGHSAPLVWITADPEHTVLLPGQSAVLTATYPPTTNYTFEWQKDNTTIPGANAGTLTVNAGQPGDYFIIVTSQWGCKDTSNIITVTDSVAGSGGRMNVYSNPNSGRFTIDYPNLPPKSSVAIYNNLGARVYTDTKIQPGQLIQVDMGTPPSGVYVVVIYDASGKRLDKGKVVIVH
ncbi:MAG: GEVED domain-containing protein [Ferruginibacter sp.]